MSSLSPERPLRRDAERNRQRILAAARTVFAEQGLEVTMDEIARAAGVGVGTVYRRFQSREEIIEALFEERLMDIAAAAEAAQAEPDAWTALTGFLEDLLALQAQDRGLKELLLSSGYGRERLEQARERIQPLVSRLVERARAAGQLRADAVAEDMALMTHMAGGVMDFTREVAPEAWRRALALLLDGLRAERSAPTPLPAPPLTLAQVNEAMACWRPRHR